MKTMIRRALLESLLQLRNPFAPENGDYILGILHGCRMSSTLSEDEIDRARALIASARECRSVFAPWPCPVKSSFKPRA